MTTRAAARLRRKADHVADALVALHAAIVEADDPGDEYLMRAALELRTWGRQVRVEAGGVEGSVGQSADGRAGPNRTAAIGHSGQEVGLTASARNLEAGR